MNIVFAEQEFFIASWNLKDFWGHPSYKSNSIADPEKLQNFTSVLTGSNYAQVDKNYDIIFVQELKWNKETNRSESFETLCDDYLSVLNYTCDSVTAGTFNGEGYGVIYREGIDVEVDYTGHPLVVPHWEQQIKKKNDRTPEFLARPPMMAKVSVDGGIFEFIVFNNHIKPSDSVSGFTDEQKQKFGSYIPGRTAEYIAFTEKELEVIFQKIKQTEFDTENIIILGDLNADCIYLENDLKSYDFIDDDWKILASNDTRTNFAIDTPCWYDRIIISDEMKDYFPAIGEPIGTYPDSNQEFRFINSEKGLSDHKLIWAKFIIPSTGVPLEIVLTPEQYEELGLYGTLSVVIGGIVSEIIIRRDM